jgi:hypothetical protein
MTIQYTSILHSKALQTLSKLGFIGLKTNHLATLFFTLHRRVARFSFGKGKMYQMKQGITNGQKTYLTAIKYTKISHSKTIQNIPKLVHLA